MHPLITSREDRHDTSLGPIRADVASLDNYIAELERVLQGVRQLRQLVVENPALADLVILSVPRHGKAHSGTATTHPTSSANGSQPVETSAKKSKPAYKGGPVAVEHFRKIAQFLETSANAPTTITEIVGGTGLKRPQVTQVLYRTHTGLFEKSDSPDSALAKLWRLTDKGLAMIKAPGEGVE